MATDFAYDDADELTHVGRPDYAWMNANSRLFLSRDYLISGESGEDRVRAAGETAERILGLDGFGARFEKYMARGYFSLASPIWTNFGRDRGLPISCFGSHIQDSMQSILETYSEIGMMSKDGGGTSAWMGELRERGANIRDGQNGKSHGSVHFAGMYDHEIRTISQGSSRRGECAVWWPISHPDAREALQIRHKDHPIQKLSYGLCVDDEWLTAALNGDKAKQELWAEVVRSRQITGYPYLFFTDTVNNRAPEAYRRYGMKIKHSNLCSEICLYNDPNESFVCCLSSMNDLYYEEWKGTDAVEVLVYFLDAVLTDFSRRASDKYGMGRAVRFVDRHRALGIGQIGWHGYLQSKMIPYQSMTAKRLNVEVSKSINDAARAASRKMAKEYGRPHYMRDEEERHVTRTAVAPTQSSSTILGQMTETTEPMTDNYGVKGKQKLTYTLRNRFLKRELARIGSDTENVWRSILEKGGSVQHLDQLSPQSREVFKTFTEIAPMEIIIQAAQRQEHIDQSQSLNMMFDENVSPRDINRVLLEGWRMKVKTFYYQKGVNAAAQLGRDILSCASCEG